MTLSIERHSLEQLAALLLERAGLKITPDGYYGLRLALQARMPALGITDSTEYVGRLKQRAGEQELRSLIPLVTVGKTEFFRDTRQFLAFEKNVMPQVMERGRLEQRPTRIWSAGRRAVFARDRRPGAWRDSGHHRHLGDRSQPCRHRVGLACVLPGAASGGRR